MVTVNTTDMLPLWRVKTANDLSGVTVEDPDTASPPQEKPRGRWLSSVRNITNRATPRSMVNITWKGTQLLASMGKTVFQKAKHIFHQTLEAYRAYVAEKEGKLREMRDDVKTLTRPGGYKNKFAGGDTVYHMLEKRSDLFHFCTQQLNVLLHMAIFVDMMTNYGEAGVHSNRDQKEAELMRRFSKFAQKRGHSVKEDVLSEFRHIHCIQDLQRMYRFFKYWVDWQHADDICRSPEKSPETHAVDTTDDTISKGSPLELWSNAIYHPPPSSATDTETDYEDDNYDNEEADDDEQVREREAMIENALANVKDAMKESNMILKRKAPDHIDDMRDFVFVSNRILAEHQLMDKKDRWGSSYEMNMREELAPLAKRPWETQYYHMMMLFLCGNHLSMTVTMLYGYRPDSIVQAMNDKDWNADMLADDIPATSCIRALLSSSTFRVLRQYLQVIQAVTEVVAWVMATGVETTDPMGKYLVQYAAPFLRPFDRGEGKQLGMMAEFERYRVPLDLDSEDANAAARAVQSDYDQSIYASVPMNFARAQREGYSWFQGFIHLDQDLASAVKGRLPVYELQYVLERMVEIFRNASGENE